ncbi:hypothetical protein DFH09DRAFT_1076740 [Mycena vulgaris]|nr:hypothetical protein DFH09DRAFT_1076740 [Mycena vulgaris]
MESCEPLERGGGCGGVCADSRATQRGRTCGCALIRRGPRGGDAVRRDNADRGARGRSAGVALGAWRFACYGGAAWVAQECGRGVAGCAPACVGVQDAWRGGGDGGVEVGDSRSARRRRRRWGCLRVGAGTLAHYVARADGAQRCGGVRMAWTWEWNVLRRMWPLRAGARHTSARLDKRTRKMAYRAVAEDSARGCTAPRCFSVDRWMRRREGSRGRHADWENSSHSSSCTSKNNGKSELVFCERVSLFMKLRVPVRSLLGPDRAPRFARRPLPKMKRPLRWGCAPLERDPALVTRV